MASAKLTDSPPAPSHASQLQIATIYNICINFADRNSKNLSKLLPTTMSTASKSNQYHPINPNMVENNNNKINTKAFNFNALSIVK